MTNREKCNILHKDMVVKLARYYKAEADLAACKIMPSAKFIDKRNQTYKAWQKAQNKYNAFLQRVVNLGKDLEDDNEEEE
jgi:hypothetical protein